MSAPLTVREFGRRLGRRRCGFDLGFVSFCVNAPTGEQPLDGVTAEKGNDAAGGVKRVVVGSADDDHEGEDRVEQPEERPREVTVLPGSLRYIPGAPGSQVVQDVQVGSGARGSPVGTNLSCCTTCASCDPGAVRRIGGEQCCRSMNGWAKGQLAHQASFRA